MGTRVRSWCLNFDAEEELAGLASSAPGLASWPVPWLGDRDVALGSAGASRLDQGSAGERFGAAWCPTPRALDRLRQAGATRLPVPVDVSVLREANRRETFADLHPLRFLGAAVGSSVPEVERLVRRTAPPRPGEKEPAWLLRRSLCAAGQGRLLAAGWTGRVEAWVNRALEIGAVHVLPMVDVSGEELAVHGFLRADGTLERGAPVVQRVSGGSWRSAKRWRSAEEDGPAELDQCHRTLEAVAARLLELGYRGAFGVDGLRWRDASGAMRVGWGSDVNARYTMSMAAGFDEVPAEFSPAG